MAEDLICGRLVDNTSLISIMGSQSPATDTGCPSMDGGGLEGKDECDVIEVGKYNHFYLL